MLGAGGPSAHCPAGRRTGAPHWALISLHLSSQARYTGLLFLHEGWPLCIHEKVVVQLASLRGVRLRPGDFYLQITAAGRQSARLVLKCLSRLGRGSEEVAVPEAMYGCVFTGEFLELVNGERNSVPLQNCLLTSGSAVYRTPWSNVTDPIFVPSKGTVLPSCPGPPRPSSVLEAPAPAPAMASPASQGHPVALPHCGGHPGSAQPRSLPSPRGAECESPRTLSGSPNRGPEGISPSEQDPWEPPKGPGGPGGRLDTVDKKDGSQALAFLADGGSPSSRRRLPGTPASLEARRWFRKSYMEALQNPMPLGSSSEESIGDEVCGSRIQGCRTRGPEAATSLAREEPPRPWRAPQQLLSEESGPGAPGGTLPRRSRSWDRTLRGSRDDSRQVPRHSASASPEGLLGGPAMETRPAGSSHPGTAESPSGTSQEGKWPPSANTPSPTFPSAGAPHPPLPPPTLPSPTFPSTGSPHPQLPPPFPSPGSPRPPLPPPTLPSPTFPSTGAPHPPLPPPPVRHPSQPPLLPPPHTPSHIWSLSAVGAWLHVEMSC